MGLKINANTKRKVLDPELVDNIVINRDSSEES